MKQRDRGVALLGAAVLLVLGGCGEAEKPAASQVLARVNGKELTVLQLNYLLAQQPPGRQLSEAQKQQVLDELVRQEILVQRAQADKLDRDPQVVQALEFARRQVLAQLVLARHPGAPLAAPSEEEIRAYYQQHEAEFRQRQRYELTAFLVPEAALDQAALREFDALADETAAERWFKQKGVPFNRQQVQVSSEGLPARLATQLRTLNPGDTLVDRANGQRVLMRLKLREEAPLTLSQAKAQILAELTRQRQQQRLEQQLVALRGDASVEYLQRFAAAAEEGPAQTAQLATGLKGLQ
ncbi:EpsD family peptidyl-prolyl cis-trans isomerase [Aeromonas sp. L_1B5_3]|uniref:EpsD family peptidyl-prolyl cis-trans isomerase n=1 Tax=Aeromonas sp. L_1B5_3 TaxID=1588629 RepID=UPI0009E5CFE6|nr:EpsD family peptidyl-prolyl cis-trans isomerase [Aeromonas sp. L_1B5_3]